MTIYQHYKIFFRTLKQFLGVIFGTFLGYQLNIFLSLVIILSCLLFIYNEFIYKFIMHYYNVVDYYIIL